MIVLRGGPGDETPPSPQTPLPAPKNGEVRLQEKL
jgi:hypothetical protein